MRTLLILTIALGVARQAAAQSSDAQCYGFAFGKWTPSLDWKMAGHGTLPDSAGVPHAPQGRSWAVNAPGRDSDSTLVLFPTWWPVGVIISFDRTPSAAGDTVLGRAYAMVADGTKLAPKSSVHAWLKPCGSPRT